MEEKMITPLAFIRMTVIALLLIVHPEHLFAQPAKNTIWKLSHDGVVKAVTGFQPQQMPALTATDKVISKRLGDRVLKVATPVNVGGNTMWAQAFKIPELFRVHAQNAGGSVDIIMMFKPDGKAVYDAASKLFRGSVAVVLWDSLSGGSTHLADPFNILVTSEDGTASPRDLQIDHTNFPPTTVALNLNPAADPAKVVFSTATNPNGDTSDFPVEPVLLVETEGREIQGFGIESIPITVALEPPVVRSSPRVAFETTMGSISPETALIDSGIARVSLRSSGVGVAKVSPKAPGFQATVREFTFVWPIRFIVASLLGGLVGVFLKGKKTFRAILSGMLTGLIIAVAWWGLGLNLLGIEVPRAWNEAGIFVMTALGSILGFSTLLERISSLGGKE
jgi:hypothetical protein